LLLKLSPTDALIDNSTVSVKWYCASGVGYVANHGTLAFTAANDRLVVALSELADDALTRLARIHAVESSWIGPDGSRRTVSRDSLLAIVGAMAEETLENESDVNEALIAAKRARRSEVLAPFFVAPAGRVDPIELAGNVDGAVLLGEDGATLAGVVDGSSITIDERLPAGLYTLTVGSGGGHHVATVLATPDGNAMAEPPRFGVRTNVSELRDRRDSDQGKGHIGLVGRLADVLDRHGIGCIATPSLLPHRPVDGAGHEGIMSRRGWSDWIINVSAAPGAVGQRHDWTAACRDEASAQSAHRAALETYSELVGHHPALRAELDRFLVGHPHIVRYARFMALGETLSEDWRRWPVPWRSGDLANAPVDQIRELYHQVAQWQADVQLRQVATAMADRGQVIEMHLDIGVHPHGYDYWHQPHLFSDSATVGQPPSDRTPHGSNSMSPAPRSNFAHDDGYRSFASTVRHQLAGGLLRLASRDNFERAWWIPNGAEPCDGAWVRLIADELLAITSLEAHRMGAMVIMTGADAADSVPFLRPIPSKCTLRDLIPGEVDGNRFRRPLEHVLSEPAIASGLSALRTPSAGI